MTEETFIQKIRTLFKERCSKGVVNISREDVNIVTDSEFAQLWTKCRDRIKRIRGVYDCVTVSGSWSTTYFIYPKPCEEFIKLNKYLTKYNIRNIGYDEIRMDIVSGKRNSYDVEDRYVIGTNRRVCEIFLNTLKQSRLNTVQKVELKPIKHCDFGDRFNSRGEDTELEWSGEFYYGLQMTRYGKRGPIIPSTEFYCYW